MAGSSQAAPFLNSASVSVESEPSLRFRRASASSARADGRPRPLRQIEELGQPRLGGFELFGGAVWQLAEDRWWSGRDKAGDGLRYLGVGLIRPRVRAKRQRQRQVRGRGGRGIRNEPRQRYDQVAPLQPAETPQVCLSA